LPEDEQTSKHGGGGRYDEILEIKGEQIKILYEKEKEKKMRKRKKKNEKKRKKNMRKRKKYEYV
jgi:hypothetical protein